MSGFSWAVEEVTGMDKIRVPYSVIKKMARMCSVPVIFEVQCSHPHRQTEMCLYMMYCQASEEPVVAGTGH